MEYRNVYFLKKFIRAQRNSLSDFNFEDTLNGFKTSFTVEDFKFILNVSCEDSICITFFNDDKKESKLKDVSIDGICFLDYLRFIIDSCGFNQIFHHVKLHESYHKLQYKIERRKECLK